MLNGWNTYFNWCIIDYSRIYSLILMSFLLPMTLNAQLRKQLTKKDEGAFVIKNVIHKKPSHDKSVITQYPDTVYCLSTKKQHGWFLPMDIVTKEKAIKHGSYIMFSQKNAAGHLTKMESFNGYGRHKHHGGNFYVLDPEDPKGNEEWKERMKKDCITLFVTDPSGENVIQERVYDEHMNLIVSFSRTPIGKNKFIGTYKDFYGFPVETRNDPDYTYGTLVVITEDKWGNDSIVEYVDAKGVAKENYNGVGMAVYVYDKYGRICRQYSANHDGHPVMDNWGNCGVEVKYNNINNLPSEKICMDSLWKPMVMPSIRDEAGSSAGVIRFLYDYDGYGRMIRERFVTMDGHPQMNTYGAHRIEYSHDEYGNVVSIIGYDLDGNLAAFNNARTAVMVFKYDSEGRESEGIFLDKRKKPCSTPGYLSRRIASYNKNGELTKSVQWCATDGVEDTTYFYIKGSNYEKYYWSDGGVRIDSIDKKGRTISSSFYDRNMNPFSYEHIGYQRYVTDYVDFANGTDYTTKYYDVNGKLYGEKAIQRCTVDSVSHIERFWDYDSNGYLVQTYAHRKDSLGNVLCQSDMNAFGIICRSGGSGGARLYDGEVFWTPKKTESSLSQIIGKDEFGEPDYIDAWGEPFYYFVKKANGSTVYYDEKSKKIEHTSDYWELCNKCPKAMSIEVVDSIAYKYGLKDNDIILLFDNYALNLVDSISDYEFKADWSLHSVLNAEKIKRMVVFRVNPNTHDYCLVEIDNLIGTPSQLGFIAHRRFLTQKQKDRILNEIRNNTSLNEAMIRKINLNHFKSSKKNHSVLVSFFDSYRSNRQCSYHLNVEDPVILIASCIYGRKKWLLDEDDTFSFRKMQNSYNYNEAGQKVFMYCTKDMKNISNFSFSEPEWKNRVSWYYTYVNDDTYRQLCTLKNKIKKDVNRAVPNLNKKLFIGTWEKVIPQKGDNSSLELCLSKDGTAACNAKVSISEEINDSIFVILSFNMTANNGIWSINKQSFTLNFTDAINEITLTGINIDGLEGDEKNNKINEIRDLFEQNKQEIAENMPIGFLKLSDINEVFIEKLDRNRICLVKDGEKIIFKKSNI